MDQLNQKFLPPEDMPALHRPFWEALKDHRLALQCCPNGHLRHIPTEICPRCGSQDSTWQEVSGRGTVYTFTVVRRAPTPAYQKDVPYVLAHVDLREGPRMIGVLSGCAPGDVRIGLPVRVEFEDTGSGWTLYRFVPEPGEVTA